MNFDNTINIFAQNKGGIGKSLTASMFIQYLQANEIPVATADLDEQSPKLSTIPGLNAALIPLLEGGEIKQTKFDPLFTKMLQNQIPFVLDLGSSTIAPFRKYMVDNGCYEMAEQFNKKIVYHMVVISGPELSSTLEGVDNIIKDIQGTDAKIVIWQNEKVGIPTVNGQPVEESDWLKHRKSYINGVVKIIDRNNQGFTDTFLKVMGNNQNTPGMTFSEIQKDTSGTFELMEKSRVQKIFSSVFSELDAVYKKEAAPSKKK